MGLESGGLEITHADRTVGIEAEDGVEGVNHCRSRGDDRAADDGHLALVNIAAPDGKPAVDDCRDTEDKAEHHDNGQAVADTRLEVGGTEGRALRHRGHRVEGKYGGGEEQ